MPLKLIRHLDEKEREIGPFRAVLKDHPVMLDRAETAHRLYRGLRDKILEEAPKLYELKGLCAGLEAGPGVVRDHQDAVRDALKDEKLEPEVAKPILNTLAAVTDTLQDRHGKNREQVNRLAGTIDGYYNAAVETLKDLARTVLSVVRAEEEPEEDWSGRGTENGQRPVETKGGNGASVTPIAAARGKNGAKKTARKPRTKRTKKTPEAPPEPPPEG